MSEQIKDALKEHVGPIILIHANGKLCDCFGDPQARLFE